MSEEINENKGIFLCQTEAALALGLTINKFQNRKRNFQTNGLTGHKKKYFIRFAAMVKEARKQYKDQLEEAPIDNNIEQLISSVDFSKDVGIVQPNGDIDIVEARRRKIIKETEYLSQKIKQKKEEMFQQWSDRFFSVFCKNFQKLKNTLIELHLTDEQLTKFNENLEFGLKNMQDSLNEILKEYLSQDEGQIE